MTQKDIFTKMDKSIIEKVIGCELLSIRFKQANISNLDNPQIISFDNVAFRFRANTNTTNSHYLIVKPLEIETAEYTRNDFLISYFYWNVKPLTQRRYMLDHQLDSAYKFSIDSNIKESLKDLQAYSILEKSRDIIHLGFGVKSISLILSNAGFNIVFDKGLEVVKREFFGS